MSELLIICEEKNEEFILERVVINGDKRKNGVGKIEGNETKRGENASRREDNNEINTQKKSLPATITSFSYPPGHLFCSRLGTRCNSTRSNNRTCTAPAYSPGRGQN